MSAKHLAVLACLSVLALAGCGESGSTQQATTTTTETAPPSARAERILKASPWWKAYGITGVEDIGSGGIFVYTSIGPGDELAATDICNAIRVLPNVVLIRVYDQNGDEVESERCGNVS